jgi:exocyst complex protein 7
MKIDEAAAADQGEGEGEGRVVATEHHIVKSQGSSDHITRDMRTVLSTFDNRPSAIIRQNPGNPHGKSIDLENNLASANRIISFWDSNASKSMILFKNSRKDAYEYLAAVDGLRHLMENLVVTHNSSKKLVRAQRLMEMSMVRLKIEFHRILSANVEPTMVPDDDNSSHGSMDDGSTDEDGSSGGRRRTRNSNANEICEIDMMPLAAVLDLRSIAKRLVTSGYGRECVRIYGLARNSVIEGCLNRIGIDRLSASDVQKMEWGILDIKIKNWIRAVSIAVRILFASEKRLCDEIFVGFNNVGDFCFAEIVQGPATKLLAFGDSVAMSKNSSERLFRVLDMYVSLLDLLPDIDTVFSQESCASVRMQASTIVIRLGESALGILKEFENAVQAENSKAPVPGGTIHPLTRYAMNYLSFLSDYKGSLMNIMAKAPIDIPTALPDDLMGMSGELDRHDNQLGSLDSALSAKLGWIIIILQCKVDSKSNLYKDVALSYLFLMNNLHYIVKKVKGSKLLGLLGYGWLRKNQEKVRHYAANYERAAWMKALHCLRDEGIHVTGGISTGVSQQVLKDRFKGFNFAIEEVFMNHSGWMVPDVQLREEIRISIAEKMIPAYRSFLDRFGKYLESGRNSEMYIKYTPEDLETRLLDLFHGDQSSLSSRNPSSVSSRRSGEY